MGVKDTDAKALDSRQQRRLQQLLDPKLDVARGIDQFSGESSSSSDEDSSSEDDVQDEHDWGELDKDAVWDSEHQQVNVRVKKAKSPADVDSNFVFSAGVYYNLSLMCVSSRSSAW